MSAESTLAERRRKEKQQAKREKELKLRRARLAAQTKLLEGCRC
jgi:hypothetical protein